MRVSKVSRVGTNVICSTLTRACAGVHGQCGRERVQGVGQRRDDKQLPHPAGRDGERGAAEAREQHPAPAGRRPDFLRPAQHTQAGNQDLAFSRLFREARGGERIHSELCVGYQTWTGLPVELLSSQTYYIYI